MATFPAISTRATTQTASGVHKFNPYHLPGVSTRLNPYTGVWGDDSIYVSSQSAQIVDPLQLRRNSISNNNVKQTIKDKGMLSNGGATFQLQSSTHSITPQSSISISELGATVQKAGLTQTIKNKLGDTNNNDWTKPLSFDLPKGKLPNSMVSMANQGSAYNVFTLPVVSLDQCGVQGLTVAHTYNFNYMFIAVSDKTAGFETWDNGATDYKPQPGNCICIMFDKSSLAVDEVNRYAFQDANPELGNVQARLLTIDSQFKTPTAPNQTIIYIPIALTLFAILYMIMKSQLGNH